MKKLKFVEESTTGLRMEEGAAVKLGEAMKGASKEAKYKRVAMVSDSFDLKAGDRSDVSLITTSAVDREGEVVMPDGIDLKSYNGVVTFAHQYDELPVGRCLWIKPRDNGLLGKTQYAPKPDGWSGDWLPDAILSLMGMETPTCTGKSIGFIRLEAHEPTPDDVRKRPELADAWLITDKAALIEYAVAPVPCNADAEMLAVAKSVAGEALAEQIIEAAKAIAGTRAVKQVSDKPAADATPAVIPVRGYVHPKTYAEAIAARILSQKTELAALVRTEVREHFLDLLGRA